jgi:peptide/nickel transport system substrate-binding protein
VKNVTLGATPPWVEYASLHIASEAPSAATSASRGGTLYVPIAETLSSLDPCIENRGEPSAILSSVFETLTREVKGARIVPWLASSIAGEDGGRRFRIKLRDGVRFHDGRQLTARDVRWSLEYLLRNEANQLRRVLAPIAGARRILDGQAEELSGFEIHSRSDFTIHLDEPIVFFPALLSHRNVAILAEGTTCMSGSWRDGCVGTGPFRVQRFEIDKRVELEANPQYWRAGFPKSDGFVFLLGVSPTETVQRLRAGQVSLASGLGPADVEALRQEPSLRAGYREAPTLSTYALFFNVRRGAFTDLARRRMVARSLDVDHAIAGVARQVVRAHSFAPPGLIGYEGARARVSSASASDTQSAGLELRAIVHPTFADRFEPVARPLFAELERMGIKATRELAAFEPTHGYADMYLGRWIGDYPDADTFMQILHSKDGAFGWLAGMPELDRLIERARSESDLAVRGATYRDIEAFIADRAVLVPLFHDKTVCIARPGVKGLDEDALSMMTQGLDYASLWLED